MLSPLLSNIMLHAFDQWMEQHYCGIKAKRDRWPWNDGIARDRPVAVREQRAWRPAVSYVRYADACVVIVKGTRAHAEAVRAACRMYLEDTLRLTLNMEKTPMTHVDDGFTFLGHRMIRKRGRTGRKRPVTQIPQDRAQRLVQRLVRELSTGYDRNRLEVMAHLNRQWAGWAAFYPCTDYTARVYGRVDHVVFWQLARWMARKYRSRVAQELQRAVRAPQPGAAKTWVMTGRWPDGHGGSVALRRLVGSPTGQFRWRNPPRNPYILAPDTPPLLTSHYRDVALAVQH